MLLASQGVSDRSGRRGGYTSWLGSSSSVGGSAYSVRGSDAGGRSLLNSFGPPSPRAGQAADGYGPEGDEVAWPSPPRERQQEAAAEGGEAGGEESGVWESLSLCREVLSLAIPDRLSSPRAAATAATAVVEVRSPLSRFAAPRPSPLPPPPRPGPAAGLGPSPIPLPPSPYGLAASLGPSLLAPPPAAPRSTRAASSVSTPGAATAGGGSRGSSKGPPPPPPPPPPPRSAHAASGASTPPLWEQPDPATPGAATAGGGSRGSSRETPAVAGPTPGRRTEDGDPGVAVAAVAGVTPPLAPSTPPTTASAALLPRPHSRPLQPASAVPHYLSARLLLPGGGPWMVSGHDHADTLDLCCWGSHCLLRGELEQAEVALQVGGQRPEGSKS